ncbi:hypothetical protein F5Y16DRAFT_411748 [Xylariaceae sp. FL0255]|nr:hypothetical protein F5Y16DRAFT_411748 [Xylariaceae sp. FL0255]
MHKHSGIQRLPYELVAYVVQNLDIEDVFNLSLTNKHFQYIIQEDNFCKPVIIAKASYTLEANEAKRTGRYAWALCRLTKRCKALSYASLYFVGNVWLRILDVHKSLDWELVIDIPTLVRLAVLQAASRRKFNRLNSTYRIFVRNDHRYLYIGTYLGEGTDSLRKWLSYPSLYLSHVVGCDIGFAVYFEIYDGWFYGLSNRTLDEIDDLDWMSYYYFIKKADSWRRQYTKGFIDDRWGLLKLEKDEGTGELIIVEYVSEAQQPVRTLISNIARLPHSFHMGDDSDVLSMLVRSKTYFCTYFRCCNIFLDLYDDDTSTDISGYPTLRLRAGARRFKPTIHEIYGLINASGRQGPVIATGDERSVIYATADSLKEGANKTLVLISFDPATRFYKTMSPDYILGEKIISENQDGLALVADYGATITCLRCTEV